MNARVSSLYARTAPSALAVAMALALGVGAPAQAYTYPGSASSSGHAVKARGLKAPAAERAAYRASGMPTHPGPHEPDEAQHGSQSGSNGQYHNPSRFGDASRDAHVSRPMPAAGKPQRVSMAMDSSHGYGNPSMQHGEACPPGSHCAPEGSGRPANGAGPAPSGAYGAHESYGYAAPQTAHKAVAPASRAIASPVRAGAGRGAVNYGPSAVSNTNFRNSVTGKTNAPSTNPTGQPTSFNGPNGKVGMGGPQSFTGPNGKSQTIGGGPDINHLGGGYGHPAGAGMNMGGVVNAQEGSMSMQQTGSTPGVANGGIDSYRADNGSAGAEKGDRTNPNFKTGQHGKNAVYDGLGSNTWFDPKDPQAGGHPENGTDRNGTQWVDNMVWDGTDSNGTEWRDGKWDGNGPAPSLDDTNARNAAAAKGDDKKGGKGGDMPADMGPDAGPGEIVNGAGNVVTPGKHKGQDDGDGPGQDSSSSKSGGQNAQGHYIAPSGQDAPVKPKEQGVLRMDYNGKNGAIDPKLNGTNGGGG